MIDYQNYYNAQIGGGNGIGRVYTGAHYQRGHGGIGSWLSGLFRYVLPVFKDGAKAVGREVLNTGINVLSDVAMRNTPVRQSLRNRTRESVRNLERRAVNKIDSVMEGAGTYKARRPGIGNQILNPLGSVIALRGKKRRRNKSGVKRLKKTVRKKGAKKSAKRRRKGRKVLKKKKKTKNKKSRKFTDIFT